MTKGLATLLSATRASAQTATSAVRQTWHTVAIGGGGFITGYSTDRTAMTRVVRTDVHGAYVWDEASDRWQQLLVASAVPDRFRTQAGINQGVFEAVVAPSDPHHLYLAAMGTVLRSRDRGQTWQEPSGSGPFPVEFDPNSDFRHYGPTLAVSPRDPGLVLFGSPAHGVWRSNDGGDSWSEVIGLPPNRALRQDGLQRSPGVLLWFPPDASGDGDGSLAGPVWAMVAGVGMFRSRDGGASFERLTAGGPALLSRGDFAPDGTFYGVDPDGRELWHFARGKWQPLTGWLRAPRRAYAAVAVDPRSAAVWTFDQGGGVARSTDGGDTWQTIGHHATVEKGDPPWLRLTDRPYFALSAVQFDTVTPGRLWAAAGTGVFYADVDTTGSSLTWVSHARGIEEIVANDAVRPPGGPALFAGWDFGIHVQSDLDAFPDTFWPEARFLMSAQQVDWCARHPEFIVTNASDARHCCAEDGKAVMAGTSRDGGWTWTRFPSLPQPPGTDANDPWRMSYGSIAVSATETDNIVWAPSSNRAPFYTLDCGRSWERVVFAGERLPFTGSHAGFWLQRKSLAADRVLPGVFYLVHSGDGDNAALAGMWRTDDGGRNWRRVFSGEVAPQSRYAAKLRAMPGKAGHLFFTSGLVDDRDTVLRRSTDGGAHWDRFEAVTHVDDVAFGRPAPGAADAALFISGRVRGRYGIWRSDDAGATWLLLDEFPLGRLDQVTVLAGDLDVFGRVYIGYQGSGWIYGEPSPEPGRSMDWSSPAVPRARPTAGSDR